MDLSARQASLPFHDDPERAAEFDEPPHSSLLLDRELGPTLSPFPFRPSVGLPILEATGLRYNTRSDGQMPTPMGGSSPATYEQPLTDDEYPLVVCSGRNEIPGMGDSLQHRLDDPVGPER